MSKINKKDLFKYIFLYIFVLMILVVRFLSYKIIYGYWSVFLKLCLYFSLGTGLIIVGIFMILHFFDKRKICWDLVISLFVILLGCFAIFGGIDPFKDVFSNSNIILEIETNDYDLVRDFNRNMGMYYFLDDLDGVKGKLRISSDLYHHLKDSSIKPKLRIKYYMNSNTIKDIEIIVKES